MMMSKHAEALMSSPKISKKMAKSISEYLCIHFGMWIEKQVVHVSDPDSTFPLRYYF